MRSKRLSAVKRTLLRVKMGRKAGFVGAGVGATISATTMQLLNIAHYKFSVGQMSASVLAPAVILGIARAFRHGYVSMIPKALCDEIGSDGKYTASFCSEQQLREANDLTLPYYGVEAVPSDVVLQWQLRNPNAFVAITNQQRELCASFGIIGLRDECVGPHMRGQVVDSDLTAADVLPHGEAKMSRRLYISGVIVRDPGSLVGRRRAAVMIWVMLMYSKILYGLRTKRTLYAIAVSPDARRLLVKMGFVVCIHGSSRRDHCDLFTYDLTQESWRAIRERVGDLSPMCSLAFTRPDS